MKNEVMDKKIYMQPQVEQTLLVGAAAILGTSSVQQLHQEEAKPHVQF